MKLKLVLLSVMLYGLVSCETMGSIDDIHPEYVLEDNTLVTDATSAQNAVNGIYASWRNIYTIYNAMFMRTGVMNYSTVLGALPFKNADIKEDNPVVKETYTSLYYIVNQSNSVIEQLKDRKIKGLSEETALSFTAEARFNRAIANFMLLRLFGEFWDENSAYGIVLWDKPVRDNVAKPRSSVKDCYDLILSDLTAAESLPVQTDKGIPVMYKANLLSAKAYKAKVLLMLGRFDEVNRLCDEVIEQGKEYGIQLEENYENIFNSAENSELLFYPYAMNTRQKVLSYWYDWANGMGNVLKKVAQSNPEDTRVLWAFGQPSGRNSYSMNKYMQSDEVENTPGNILYFLRLAEVYLMKAEALLRKASPDAAEARKALKPLMVRAGYVEQKVDEIPDEDMLMTIFIQKYLELFGENFEDWFDMVRYHMLNNTDWVTMGFLPNWENIILPIPKDAMAGNNKLVQNKSYIIN